MGGHLVFEGIIKDYKEGTLITYIRGWVPPRPLSVSALGSGPAESWAASEGCGEDFPGLEVARQ